MQQDKKGTLSILMALAGSCWVGLLAEEMARLLKAYRPWRVSFINGEYRADGIAHWAFPYLLDK